MISNAKNPVKTNMQAHKLKSLGKMFVIVTMRKSWKNGCHDGSSSKSRSVKEICAGSTWMEHSAILPRSLHFRDAAVECCSGSIMHGNMTPLYPSNAN